MPVATPTAVGAILVTRLSLCPCESMSASGPFCGLLAVSLETNEQ